MQVTAIPLKCLVGHPLNANVMGKARLTVLRRHIERTGRYEPLVVRRHPTRAGCYELLNGHHRKQVLEQLGYERADCVVWDVSDEEALVLLATLNRLEGRDDLRRRAELLDRLNRRFSREQLAAWLPESRGQLEKRLKLRTPPLPVPPERAEVLPQALTFFVREDQRRIIERALRRVREDTAGDDPEGKLTRGDLLTLVARRSLAFSEGAGREQAGRAMMNCREDEAC